MIVRAASIRLYLPQSYSLKDKRQILRSLKTRLHNRFPLAVAEVGLQDKYQHALLGIACVSEQSGQTQAILEKAYAFVEQELDVEILQIDEIEAST